MPYLRAPLLSLASVSAAVAALGGCGTMVAIDDVYVPYDMAARDLPAGAGADLSGADLSAGAGDLTGGGGTPDLAGQPAGGGLFPPGAPWNTPVDKANLDAQSAAIINGLQAAGGWGNGDRFQIDFSLLMLEADANTPTRSFTRTGDFFSPDCDYAPVPVPPGGAIEGEADYHCASDGDCHLIVIDRPHARLYEMWRADILSAQVFNGGCLAIWDMNRRYPANGRGEGCTSADAAGFSIAALLPHADEVWAAVQKQGSLDHGLRFILPNARIARRILRAPGHAQHQPDGRGGGHDAALRRPLPFEVKLSPAVAAQRGGAGDRPHAADLRDVRLGRRQHRAHLRRRSLPRAQVGADELRLALDVRHPRHRLRDGRRWDALPAGRLHAKPVAVDLRRGCVRGRLLRRKMPATATARESPV